MIKYGSVIFLSISQVAFSVKENQIVCTQKTLAEVQTGADASFARAISLDWSEQDFSSVAKAFHPKLAVSEKVLTKMHGDFKRRLGDFKSVQLEALYEVKSPEGRTKWASCDTSVPGMSGRFEFLTHYGYKEYSLAQMRFQLKSTEIVYAMFSVLPEVLKPVAPGVNALSNQGFRIGFLEIFQTTAAQKTAVDWLVALKDLDPKTHPLTAMISAENAKKLSKFGTYVRLPLKEELEGLLKDDALRLEALEYLKNLTGENTIRYVDSLFFDESYGIVIRFEVDPAASMDSMKKLCFDTLRNFKRQNKEKLNFDKVQCSFVRKTDDAAVDGDLGTRIEKLSEIN